jgi:biotin synthase
MSIRYDWTIGELKELYDLPFLELISKSHALHIQFHKPAEVQVCSLISIKTGGCPEDCKYCAQSSHYQTPVSAQPMMQLDLQLSAGRGKVAALSYMRPIVDSSILFLINWIAYQKNR